MAKKKLIDFILFGLLILRLLKLMPSAKELLGKSYDYPALKNAYYSSQYMLEENYSLIPDDTIYNFSAGYYLRGGSPILVNSEQPPLGKYLLALSILLFQNTTLMIYLFFWLTILGVFLLAKKLFKNNHLALLTTILFSFDKLFVSQLRTVPMLDIFQLCFLVFSFYFFLRWQEKEKKSDVIFTSLFFGATIAVKFFITGVVVFISWLFFLLLKKRWRQIFPLTFWLGLSTYLILSLNYLKVLLEEFNLLKPLAIQKWIYWYHSNKLTSIGTIWPLIYCNRWQTWWADRAIISDPQWWIGLPILFTFAFIISLIYLVKKPKDENLEIVLIWVIAYSGFISLAQASLRYVIPILPFLYLVTIKSLVLIYEIFKKKV